jgi:hypothetical protein
MTNRSLKSSDHGMVLPIVLVFVVVLGVVVLALARYAGAGLKYGEVTAGRADRLAAADSGIRFAVEELRLNDSTCTTALGGGGVALASPSVNGAAVSVSCRHALSSVDNTAGWAVVVTGGQDGRAGTGKLAQNGGSQRALIGGRTFLANRTANTPFIAAGDVWYSAPDCTAPVPPAGITQDPGYTLNCVVQTWNELFTAPSLANVPPVSLLGSVNSALSTASCTVYNPGRYGALTVDGNAYFMSGEYYFDGRLEIGGKSTALAGFSDGLGDSQVLGSEDGFAFPSGFNDCSFAQQFDRENSAPFGGGRGGVTMYFGGSGRLTVDTGSSGYIEIMRRNQGGRSVSIHDLNDSRGFGVPVIGVKTGTGYTVVLHGLVWAPYSRLVINANGNSWGAASGGVVAGHIDYRMSHSPPPFIFGVETSTIPTRVVLTSTATDSDGVSTAVQAVAEVIPGQAEGQVLLNSWRVCGATC